jgi:23S rRNA pseudouridine2604 synthase
METRINKYLSQVGYCSRREADKLIDQGRVTVNNSVVEHGYKITQGDIIKVDSEKINNNIKSRTYLIFNKPRGIVCTTDTEKEDQNIIDYINYKKRIFPIGRLDKMSEGLIFLTDDGEIVNKILRSRYMHEKEYLVTVNKKITSDFIEKMANGIPILNTITKKCIVKFVSDYQFKIILTQGLNRQIRRMCEYLGYEVKRLKRIRIMNIKLDLKKGEYRFFKSNELCKLQELLAQSSKTFDDNF